MRKDKVKPYAFVSASVNHGYGHLYVRLYDMFNMSSSATYAAQCQTGGHSREQLKSYAWQHGLSNDLALSDTGTLKTAYYLSRRVDRGMNEAYNQYGSPQTFAEYALRFLRACEIRTVHVNTVLNAGYTELTTLPTFDAICEGDSLRNLIHALEGELLSRT